jgi:hypothetical protein
LFNLCLESLLQVLNTYYKDNGAFVGPAQYRIGFVSQTYADDIIFIARGPEGIQKMLGTLENFTNWSQMEVNVKKCATASYLLDGNRHRSHLREKLKFTGQEIPNLT